jgi:hypothetical protein
MADGRCPSCMKPFAEATPEEAERAEFERQQQMEIRAQASKRVNDGARRDMLIGGVVFLFGTGLTVLTYVGASGSGGGTYVVCWGAILFGLIQFFRGVAKRA